MELILNITLFEFKATKITYSNPQTQKNDLKWNGGIFVICKQMLHGWNSNVLALSVVVLFSDAGQASAVTIAYTFIHASTWP